MIKRYLFLLLSLILILCLCVPTSAHSGKTDASGGHYDHSTGEYHYHHGYPAHSHVGGCPYDYDDNTNYRPTDGSSSLSSSSRSDSSGCTDISFDKVFTFFALIFIAFLFFLQFVAPFIGSSKPKEEPKKPTSPPPIQYTKATSESKKEKLNTEPIDYLAKYRNETKSSSQDPEPPKQYIRTYPSPKTVQPPQPPREPNDYLRNYKKVQSSGIRCDSTGNIKPASSSVNPPKKRKAPLIVTIALVVVFVLLCALCLVHDSSQDSNPETPETHAHEYVNGQCSSCLSYDTAYWWPKYREILDIMSSMDSPIDDLITIEEKLKDLPEDYLQVKRITAQQFVLYKQCTIIRDESAANDPDYEKIQEALFSLLEKKDSENYDSWNMSSLVESFFDSSLYANGNITWSLLRGYWESSTGYYLSFDSSGVTSNIPHPYSNTFGYHYFAYDDIVYVSKSPDGPWLEAYRIDKLSGDGIVLHCYSTDTSYFLVHKES